jgi:hypothetical protein
MTCSKGAEPGTRRRSAIAARYIAAQFEALGLEDQPARMAAIFSQFRWLAAGLLDPSTRLNLKGAAGSLDLAFATRLRRWIRSGAGGNSN